MISGEVERPECINRVDAAHGRGETGHYPRLGFPEGGPRRAAVGAAAETGDSRWGGETCGSFQVSRERTGLLPHSPDLSAKQRVKLPTGRERGQDTGHSEPQSPGPVAPGELAGAQLGKEVG